MEVNSVKGWRVLARHLERATHSRRKKGFRRHGLQQVNRDRCFYKRRPNLFEIVSDKSIKQAYAKVTVRYRGTIIRSQTRIILSFPFLTFMLSRGIRVRLSCAFSCSWFRFRLGESFEIYTKKLQSDLWKSRGLRTDWDILSKYHFLFLPSLSVLIDLRFLRTSLFFHVLYTFALHSLTFDPPPCFSLFSSCHYFLFSRIFSFSIFLFSSPRPLSLIPIFLSSSAFFQLFSLHRVSSAFSTSFPGVPNLLYLRRFLRLFLVSLCLSALVFASNPFSTAGDQRRLATRAHVRRIQTLPASYKAAYRAVPGTVTSNVAYLVKA